jgi:hypothetical protein
VVKNKYKLLPALLLTGASQASVAASGYFQTPFISVVNDELTTEVCVDIVASGEETISYPVDLTFTAQDTADETITNSSLNLTLADSEANRCLSLDLSADFGASDKVLVSVASASSGVTFGPGTSLLVTRLASGEAVQPVIGISASQNSVITRKFITDQGGITFTASDTATNNSNLVYSWVVTNSSDETVETDTDGDAQLLLDPTFLPPGIYKVLASATENTLTGNVNAVTMTFTLSAPSEGLALEIDSDLDGISDSDEGSAASHNVVSNNETILQTQYGLTAKLGELSFEVGASDAVVNYGEFESWAGSSITNLNAIDQVVNFTVSGIDVPGSQVLTVVKLDQPVASTKIFYKFNDVTNQWQSFSLTDGDNYYSATSNNGVCPEPSLEQYSSGISAGSDCLMLRITDGGPNDSDLLVNGSISDPGGVGNVPESNNDSSSSSSSGDVVAKMEAGSFSYWMIALSLLILAGRVKSRK